MRNQFLLLGSRKAKQEGQKGMTQMMAWEAVHRGWTEMMAREGVMETRGPPLPPARLDKLPHQ
jgi:hypothetical protein